MLASGWRNVAHAERQVALDKCILRARRNVLRTDGGGPMFAVLRPVPCFLASVAAGRYSQHRVVGML